MVSTRELGTVPGAGGARMAVTHLGPQVLSGGQGLWSFVSQTLGFEAHTWDFNEQFSFPSPSLCFMSDVCDPCSFSGADTPRLPVTQSFGASNRLDCLAGDHFPWG